MGMIVTRLILHEEFDKMLDAMGIGDDIPMAYSAITLEYIVQDGKPHIVVGERRTVRPIPMKGTV